MLFSGQPKFFSPRPKSLVYSSLPGKEGLVGTGMSWRPICESQLPIQEAGAEYPNPTLLIREIQSWCTLCRNKLAPFFKTCFVPKLYKRSVSSELKISKKPSPSFSSLTISDGKCADTGSPQNIASLLYNFARPIRRDERPYCNSGS